MPNGEISYQSGRVGIVCLGLIGGSFAKALHAGGREVYASDRTRSTLELAMIESVNGELNEETIPSCELIVLAGYPDVSISWLRAHADLVSPGSIVIDAVGVKRVICETCEALAREGGFTFVGCHPMAGSQHSGYAHARADLFKGASMVVVPPAMDDFERLEVLERLKHLLSPCAFGTYTLTTAAEHDAMIAYTSQLAHVIANAYVKSPTAQRRLGFSGGSFRDLTRVAHLNAPMWTELFLVNRDNLARELTTFIEELSAYRDALERQDAEALEALLAEGDQIKRKLEEEEATHAER